MELTILYHVIVGIDISKKVLAGSLFDCRSRQGHPLQVSNNDEGFKRLGQWLQQMDIEKSKVVLCSEHTGRYGEHLLNWTTQNSWNHAVVKTTALGKVGQEHHRKNDQYDAKLLAEYGRGYEDCLLVCTTPLNQL